MANGWREGKRERRCRSANDEGEVERHRKGSMAVKKRKGERLLMGKNKYEGKPNVKKEEIAQDGDKRLVEEDKRREMG